VTVETGKSSVEADSSRGGVPLSPLPIDAVRRHFAVDVAWTLGARILTTVNSVVAGIIVARWLGAEGLGKLAVINVTVATAVQLGSAGLPSANTYFIAQDKRRFAPAVVNSFIFAILIGSLLALVLTGLARWKPDWFGFIEPRLIGIAALSIPFVLVSIIGLNVFLAVGRIGRFNLLDLLGQSFVLINAIVALVILNAGLWMVVSLNTAVNVALGILIGVLVLAYGAKIKDALAWRPDLQLFGRMLRYGAKFHISILAGLLIFRADLLVVNYFRGETEAGVYSVASQVALMLMLLPGIIATLLFPRAAANPDETGELTCVVTRHTAFVMLFVCLAVAPASFLLPLLYGAEFSDSSVQLLILLPGVYLIGLESVMVQHFNAMGLPVLIPVFWVVTLIINIALTFALVPSFGAWGAALASTLSYALIFLLVAIYFRARTGRAFSEAFLPSGQELRDLITLRHLSVSSKSGPVQ
jgi:O-antigen/teichoic acid export membrane protein